MRIASILLFALAALASARTWTIMPLGDSITEGGDTFHCYRQPLAKMLADGHYDVRFVGTRHRDGDHEGYGGKNTEFLAENFDRLYRANPADIILLHSGHNHFAEENPVPGILKATAQIIDTARQINPKVIVLLAQVIPSGKLPKYSYIPELNRELAKLAAEKQVILVDQASGFHFETDTIADHVHPNAAGAEKMAQKWYDALTPVVGR